MVWISIWIAAVWISVWIATIRVGVWISIWVASVWIAIQIKSEITYSYCLAELWASSLSLIETVNAGAKSSATVVSFIEIFK